MTPVPASIDATGKTDVTIPLQEMFNRLTPGAVIDFDPAARYRCEDKIVINDKRDVTLNFNYCKIGATTLGYRERAHLCVTDSKGVRLVKPAIRGSMPYSGLDARAYNPNYEAQHGIRIWSSVGVIIDRPRVESVWGDWLYIGRANPHHPWSSWINVVNPWGRHNGRIGMSVIAASIVHVSDPDFDRMRRSVFDFEPDSASDGAFGVVVEGDRGKSRIGRCHTGFLGASHGKKGIVANIEFRNLYLPEHNVSFDFVSPPVEQDDGSFTYPVTKKDIRVVGCRSEDRIEQTAIRFVRATRVRVRDNVQPKSRPAIELVRAVDCTDVWVDGKRLAGT